MQYYDMIVITQIENIKIINPKTLPVLLCTYTLRLVVPVVRFSMKMPL